MSKQLILHFDTADRNVRNTLVMLQDSLFKSGRDKMLKGNLAGARTDFIKIIQVCDGMNPVRPFVRECFKKGGAVETSAAYSAWIRRVKKGQELPLRENIFRANFRRAIHEEFGILPAVHNGNTFEGVSIDVR